MDLVLGSTGVLCMNESKGPLPYEEENVIKCMKRLESGSVSRRNKGIWQ